MPPRQQQRAAAAPVRLSTGAYALHALAALLLLALFAVGLAGLLIIMDGEGKNALSRTVYAEHWRWLISKNAFFQPFAVNFGAIGFGYCVSKLLSHHRAAAAAPAAAAGAPAKKRE
ncbi:hypothetical protein Rsub_01279 [Raphidocelis subcapitata]|uniref:Uncharacterized protein n=1 Tax=Raphidocelis subcapitata TaxID=307507 RepID=A0A2V0NM70_9CHLO|nr:hypothetical protein Rsub_01279 [Raphidocelis subcapitata]|eukprot:GBF88564.1 hypothetical protein Rsub_01279 [Raphidocelis subcapitata]